MRGKMIPYHYQATVTQQEAWADGFLDVAEADKVFDISWEALEEMKNRRESSLTSTE